MAQDVAVAQYVLDEVQPVVGFVSYRLPIKLKPSTTFTKGELLGPVTGQAYYGPYASGNNDGTQLPECILGRACITDAAGNASYGNITGGEFGQTWITTEGWFAGLFLATDIVASGSTGGLDANAVTALKGRLLKGSTYFAF